MKELKSFIVLYNGKFIRAYEESEADEVIAELKADKDRLQQQLDVASGELFALNRSCSIAQVTAKKIFGG